MFNPEVAALHTQARNLESGHRFVDAYAIFERLLDGPLDHQDRCRVLHDLVFSSSKVFARHRHDVSFLPWARRAEHWFTEATNDCREATADSGFRLISTIASTRYFHSLLIESKPGQDLRDQAYQEAQGIADLVIPQETGEFVYHKLLHDIAYESFRKANDEESKIGWLGRWSSHAATVVSIIKRSPDIKTEVNKYLEYQSEALHELANIEPIFGEKDRLNRQSYDVGLAGAEEFARAGKFKVAAIIAHKMADITRYMLRQPTQSNQNDWALLDYDARMKSGEYDEEGGYTQHAAAAFQTAGMTAYHQSISRTGDQKLDWLKRAYEADLRAAQTWDEAGISDKAVRCEDLARTSRKKAQEQFGEDLQLETETI